MQALPLHVIVADCAHRHIHVLLRVVLVRYHELILTDFADVIRVKVDKRFDPAALQ